MVQPILLVPPVLAIRLDPGFQDCPWVLELQKVLQSRWLPSLRPLRWHLEFRLGRVDQVLLMGQVHLPDQMVQEFPANQTVQRNRNLPKFLCCRKDPTVLDFLVVLRLLLDQALPKDPAIHPDQKFPDFRMVPEGPVDQQDQLLLVYLRIRVYPVILDLPLLQWDLQVRPVLQALRLPLDQVVLYFPVVLVDRMGHSAQCLLLALMVHSVLNLLGHQGRPAVLFLQDLL